MMMLRVHWLFAALLCFTTGELNALLGQALPAEIADFAHKHCVACHGPEKKKADLDLHVFKTPGDMLKARKVWRNVVEMVREGDMPPQGKPRPSPAEAERFVRAVSEVFERADSAAKPDPGHVTMRRLNRTEYNNTVRDLLGIDFKVAEDFPADDVGYGFDNIGDVLTISPLLMERHLAAAETAVKRALVMGDPPPPANRPRIAIFLEPRRFGEKGFRSIHAAADSLSASYTLTEEGDYKARVKVHGHPAGAELPKLGIFVNDQQVGAFDVKPASQSEAAYVEAAVKLKAGSARVSAKLLNEFKTEGSAGSPAKQRGLAVHQIQLQGPFGLPASHRKLLAHAPDLGPREAAREVLARFATRAYRRPATPGEVDRLLELFDQALKHKERWEAAVGLAMQAALSSPKFLFRVELDSRGDSPGPRVLDDYQLASRLSYFLWSTMPDDELFALAAEQQLHRNLEAQVRRMLKSPKAKALVENFALQWLQLRTLAAHQPDKDGFPEFDEPLRQAMLRETELFLQAIIAEDRSILELIDSDFTFLNERLARHYGIVDTHGNKAGGPAGARPGAPIVGQDFVRVTLADKERGGLLTQASVLTVTSNPTRTSPVKRGRWVLEQMLGTPPPPPPPDVPELENSKQLKGTLRQRMEQHRENPSCAGCHARMDPIGFAFENYDAVGKFRKTDGGSPIDPSGALPGNVHFNGPAELKRILQAKTELFSRCLSEKLLTYALGRGLEFYDKRAVDTICANLARDNFRFSTLAVEIARSDPFRMQRGAKAPD